MSELTEGQRRALENLARKDGGEEVGWINIADARVLAELGLADRGRAGWTITPAGTAALGDGAEGAPSAPAPTSVVDF